MMIGYFFNQKHVFVDNMEKEMFMKKVREKKNKLNKEHYNHKKILKIKIHFPQISLLRNK